MDPLQPLTDCGDSRFQAPARLPTTPHSDTSPDLHRLTDSEPNSTTTRFSLLLFASPRFSLCTSPRQTDSRSACAFYPPWLLAPPFFQLPRETSRRRAFFRLNRGHLFSFSRASFLPRSCSFPTLFTGSVVRFPSINARLLVVIAEVETRWCGCEGCG